MSNTNETLTNEAARKMFSEWLTGNDERDAQKLKRAFRTVGLSINQWRQIVAEIKAEAS